MVLGERERMGIEPTKRCWYGASAVLKTVGSTRNPDAPMAGILRDKETAAQVRAGGFRANSDGPLVGSFPSDSGADRKPPS